MYGVYSKRSGILGLMAIIAVLAAAFGTVGKVAQASALPRPLPIYSVQTDEKKVALGINCAWSDEDIDQLIALLEKKNIKATFFIVGNWSEKYPEAVRKLADAGHELGSHSHTHPDMTKLTREQIMQELVRSREEIEKTARQPIRLFRAPSGAYNDLVVETARNQGWEVIQWSNDSVDWKDPPVQEMVNQVCGRAAPGDIMLFHAGKKNSPQAIEQVIDTLQKEGYQFVTVGELIHQEPYEIDHTGRQSKK